MAPATAWPPDSNKTTGFSPDLWNQHDHWWQQEPETSIQTLGCRRAMDPVMASSCSPDPDITMVPSGSVYHSHLYGPGYSMALGHQHSLRWLIRSQATIWPLVATGTTDINADPGCGCRVTDPDMALSSSTGLDNTSTSSDTNKASG